MLHGTVFSKRVPLAAGGIVIDRACYTIPHYTTSHKAYYVNQIG
jgi:hypothetical protein